MLFLVTYELFACHFLESIRHKASNSKCTPSSYTFMTLAMELLNRKILNWKQEDVAVLNNIQRYEINYSSPNIKLISSVLFVLIQGNVEYFFDQLIITIAESKRRHYNFLVNIHASCVWLYIKYIHETMVIM